MRPLLILLTAVGLAGPAAHARDVDGTPQAVLATIHALDTALVAKDVPALSALLEPDFVGTVPSGVALARDAYVAFHTRPQEGLVAIETAAGTEPTLRVYEGRFAVVNRRVAVRRADAAGKVEAFEVQRIEVLRLADGHWRLVSGQGTRVQH
jgi:nitric oxide reductase activation protein